MENFRRRPNMDLASKVGEPTLVDPKIVSPTDVAEETVRVFSSAAGKPGPSSIGVETVKGPLGPSQNAPRSDAPPANPQTLSAPPAPAPDTAAPTNGAAAAPAAGENPYGELKPDAAASDTNAAPDAAASDTAAAPAEVPPPALLRKPMRFSRARRTTNLQTRSTSLLRRIKGTRRRAARRKKKGRRSFRSERLSFGRQGAQVSP